MSTGGIRVYSLDDPTSTSHTAPAHSSESLPIPICEPGDAADRDMLQYITRARSQLIRDFDASVTMDLNTAKQEIKVFAQSVLQDARLQPEEFTVDQHLLFRSPARPASVTQLLDEVPTDKVVRWWNAWQQNWVDGAQPANPRTAISEYLADSLGTDPKAKTKALGIAMAVKDASKTPATSFRFFVKRFICSSMKTDAR
jgi:hypothetical protein